MPLWKEIERLTGTHCLAKVEGVLAVGSGKVVACEDLRGTLERKTQTDGSFSVLSWPRPRLAQLERDQPEDETIPRRQSNSYTETLLQESYGKDMSFWTWDQQTTSAVHHVPDKDHWLEMDGSTGSCLGSRLGSPYWLRQGHEESSARSCTPKRHLRTSVKSLGVKGLSSCLSCVTVGWSLRLAEPQLPCK